MTRTAAPVRYVAPYPDDTTLSGTATGIADAALTVTSRILTGIAATDQGC